MKILFAPMASSSLAHMSRLFAIADEMIKRGHQITFTSTHDRKDFIKKSGYSVYKRTYLPVNFNDPQDQSLNYLKEKRKHFIDWFDTEIEASTKLKADLVVTSPGFLGPHVTIKTGIPTLSVLNAPYLAQTTGVLGLSLTKKSLKNDLLKFFLNPIFEKKFTKLYLSEVLKMYEELGIEFLGKTKTDLYDCMDIVIPSIYEIEPIYPKDKYFYSGPLFWDGFENNYELDEEKIKKFKGDKNLIYLSFGGSIFNLDFYNNIFDVIGRLPYKFIISTGNNFEIEDFKFNKKNTLIYKFVPGLKACKLSDIVINTGSHGTIMQALKNAKPLICIPCNIDQSFFSYRVEELGLGLNINKTNILKFSQRESYYKLNPNLDNMIVRGIKELLRDPSYKLQALKFSVKIQRKGKASKNIANYIEDKYGD